MCVRGVELGLIDKVVVLMSGLHMGGVFYYYSASHPLTHILYFLNFMNFKKLMNVQGTCYRGLFLLQDLRRCL